MWTPKRVILLAVGFAVFCMAYMVYAHFLGGINGLPPLPEEYGPVVGKPKPLPLETRENEADRKLRIAFGPDCEEVTKRNIKVELQSRGMVLAAQDIKFKDGRVELTPFSLAIFGKDNADEKAQEINTVKCLEAKVTFDKPVNNIAEMGNNVRKITAAELSGDVYITNNRRTPQLDDDLTLFTQGPLYYEESLHRVWTAAVVRVTDLQSKPKPMAIYGTRMHLYLTPENQAPIAVKQASAKTKANSSMKVERIELERDVEMNLFVDARSGFLGAGPNDKGQEKATTANGKAGQVPAQKSPEPAQAEKAKVIIRTQGPFRYDLLTDRATFDISHHSGPRPNVVQVDRVQDLEDKNDHLECDHLEIQFRRKNTDAAQAPRDGGPEGLDIETVHATGKEVILLSDSEVLEAHGNDLFHDKKRQLSILKGQPRMWALKEGNEIEAPELQLLDVKGAQQAIALGQGHIRMLDKKTGERPQEAHWKTKLIYAKDGPYDLLWLTGDASFVDHEHGQQLKADVLKAWLEPAKEEKPSAGDDPQHRLLHHVDALGQVQALAPDMRVHDTEHLVIWFKDAPLATIALPATTSNEESPSAAQIVTSAVAPQQNLPVTSSGSVPSVSAVGPESRDPLTAAKPSKQNGAPTQPGSQSALPSAAATPTNSQPNGTKPKPPIDLSARDIEAHVLRSGTKNELDKLGCLGTVRVLQAPSGPDDKGTDIRGDKLDLVRKAEGNNMTVIGNDAHVQLDKLYIVGPEINLDQTTNDLWVNGMGAMRMPSDGNFSGTRLAQATGTKSAPPADLTISWQKHMFFDGQIARFDWLPDADSRYGVRAEQNTGHLACNRMEVTLDRRISLREGDKGKQQAKVQSIVCDKNVWVEDSKREGTRVIASQRIACPQLYVDNDLDKDDSIVNAPGPGTVRIFQLGTKGDVLPPPGGTSTSAASSSRDRATVRTPASKDKQEGEFKLTRIIYQSRMYANNKQDIAKFYDKVVLIHVPTDDPDLKLDESHLPPGYLYMSCEKLEVLKNKLADGRTYQEMRAYKKVAIDAQEFSGNADVVKYDESKEQVILEGSDGNLAVLTRQKVRGGRPDTVKGKKIIYWRTTGNYQVDEGREIQVTQ